MNIVFYTIMRVYDIVTSSWGAYMRLQSKTAEYVLASHHVDGTTEFLVSEYGLCRYVYYSKHVSTTYVCRNEDRYG